MSINSLRPNVQDLQRDALTLLSDIENLMSSVSDLLADDDSGEKYRRFQKEISNAKDNVKNLELVMAIVAPMKAGKSTIINAIAGQDILPSRASAMTTLPTRIRLHSNADEPKLELDSTTFLSILRSLQQKIQLDDEVHVLDKMERYPHLSELIQKIKDGFSIESTTIGLEAIKETLTDLNDAVRVCTILDPWSNPLNQEEFDIPCISTPFWKATDTSQAKLLGNLVIVDTPGPNEAGENLKLSVVVEEQLRKSSMVLIVLDFTQLNNKAAEEIKRQVEPVVRLLGKENLYVLINKVDQRTEQDPMTSEKVKQFVQADLGLGDSSDAERVFEVAARWAFCAANFLSEMQRNPGIAKEEMKTARALAEQVFGIDWKEDFEDCSLEQLQRKAKRLWKKSGFEPFLENAISILMESAAPRCITSALNLSQKHLEELRDDVQLRSSAIAKDEGKLRLEIGALEKDLKHLELCRKRLKKVDKIRNELKGSLENLLTILKSKAEVSLEDYFAKEEFESGNPIQKANIASRDFFSATLARFEIFPDWISKRMKSFVEFKTTGVFEFDQKYKAEEFASQAVAYAQQRVESLLTVVKEQMNQEVKEAHLRLKIFLEQETNPIIERARTRLNQSFDITLSLPVPTLDTSDDLSVNKPSIKSQTKTIDQGYGKITVKKRVFWHWLWMIPVDVTETVKIPDKTVNYYTVSLNELIPEINQSIESSIAAIGENLNNYFDDDFQERVDYFFNALDAYLNNYKDNLMQAQKDQKLAVVEKKKLINGLTSTVPQATEQIEKCKAQIEKAKSLIPIQKTDKE
jgi:hypothetical protein